MNRYTCNCNLVGRLESIRMNESERAQARAYMQAGEAVADFICRAAAIAQTLAARLDSGAAHAPRAAGIRRTAG